MKVSGPPKYDLEFFMICFFNLFAVIFLFQVRNLNQTAALFPIIVSTFVLILGIFALICRLWPRKKQLPAPESQTEVCENETIQSIDNKGDTMSWLVSLLWIVVYFLLLFIVGFVLATVIYALVVPLAMDGFNKRNVRTGIIFAVLMAAIMVGFERAFYIELPQGYLLELMKISL